MTTTINGVQYREVNREAEVGEKIKIVNAYIAIGRYENGDVFEVTKVVRDLRGHHPHVYVKETEMEAQLTEAVKAVEAAKRSEAEAQRLKVGDYAKVVPGGMWHPLEVGDIVEIFIDDKDHQPFKARRISDGNTGWFEEKQLISATDEEVAEAKRKLEEQRKKAEESAKWAAIGREVGEFKKGDVVKFTDDYTDIGIVKDIGGSLLGVRTMRATNSYQAPRKDTVELIAPVESLFNAS